MPGPYYVDHALRAQFGKTVKAARELAKLSQQELADRMQVPRSYISKLENTRSLPKLDQIVRLGDALGMPAWKLLRHAQRFADADHSTPITNNPQHEGASR